MRKFSWKKKFTQYYVRILFDDIDSKNQKIFFPLTVFFGANDYKFTHNFRKYRVFEKKYFFENRLVFVKIPIFLYIFYQNAYLGLRKISIFFWKFFWTKIVMFLVNTHIFIHIWPNSLSWTWKNFIKKIKFKISYEKHQISIYSHIWLFFSLFLQEIVNNSRLSHSAGKKNTVYFVNCYLFSYFRHFGS